MSLPKEYKDTKKPVLEDIKKLFKRGENDSIEQEVLHLTNLEQIKQDLFGDMGDSQYLVVRIYIKHNVLKTAKEMLMGGIACYTQEMGAAHIGIQIANRIVHWLGCGFALVKDWKGAGATALFYPQNNEDIEVPFIDCSEELKDNVAKLIQKWNCLYSYSSLKHNCQRFSSEMLKVLGLKDSFSNFTGPTGEFIEHISKLQSMKKDVYPCIVRKGKVIQEWKTHEELDNWQNENFDAIQGYESLLKAFHRAYQLRGDNGIECPSDRPTILVSNEGEKTDFDLQSHFLGVGSGGSSVPSNSVSKTSSTNSMPTKNNSDKGKPLENSFPKKDNLPVNNTNVPEVDGNGIKLPVGFNRTRIEDNNLKTCPTNRCGSSFSFFSRKQYCEYCKKAYCSNCTKNTIDFPENHLVLNSFGTSQKQKVCNNCFANITIYWKDYDEFQEKKNKNKK
eukprot:TRINITY_DN8927_c0_g1_i1.p1 TRINITY_DN8927_c0_g1~~TRINITY_DN8927_c0_g1_i1.p1  ORF type:complete len:455 (-),score=111.19 TRINITY_DN8927_c0_g1_i1:11-1351(-)